MNKADFIKILAKNMNSSIADADLTLKHVFKTVSETIAKEDYLAFVGFGTFRTAISKARDVKTPRGDIVHVPKKRLVRFVPGSELKAKVNTQKS
jgi:nucleoid DNA-binding protein